jgi:GcrA cell cycle regulator
MAPFSSDAGASPDAIRDALILRLWNAGAPVSRIRARAGCGGDVITRVLAAARAEGRDVSAPRRAPGGYAEWSQDRVETMRALWLKGESASAIGRAIGVGRGAVIGKLSRLGVERAEALNQRNRDLAGRLATQASRAAAEGRPPPGRRKAPRETLSPTCDLTGLSAHTCRWPIGAPGEAAFGFCGRLARKTYCEVHAARAYAPPPEETVEALAGLEPQRLEPAQRLRAQGGAW